MSGNDHIKGLLIVLLFNFVFSVGAQAQKDQQENPSSTWQLQPINIDGSDDDWTDTALLEDNKTGLKYNVTNNDSLLFLFIKIRDDVTKTKFLAAGFELSLNAEGRKKRSCSIKFPLKNETITSAGQPIRNLKTTEALALGEINAYELDGFDLGNGHYTLSEINKAGIKIALGVNDKGEIIYEAAVPFSSFYKKQSLGEEDYGKSFALAFSLNGFPNPSASGMDSPPGPRTGGGGRRGRGSPPESSQTDNGRGNYSQGFRGDTQKLFISSRSWEILALAGKK